MLLASHSDRQVSSAHVVTSPVPTTSATTSSTSLLLQSPRVTLVVHFFRLVLRLLSVLILPLLSQRIPRTTIMSSRTGVLLRISSSSRPTQRHQNSARPTQRHQNSA